MENETKTCKKCGQEISITNFYFNKATGKPQAYCKPCSKEITKQYKRDHNTDYNQIIRNRWSSINQRAANGKYTTSNSAQKCPQLKSYRAKGILVLFSFDDFKAWMWANKAIHDEIVVRGETSSIDRIFEDGDYELTNLQLVSLHENIEKRMGKVCNRSTEEQKEKKKKVNQKSYNKSKAN